MTSVNGLDRGIARIIRKSMAARRIIVVGKWPEVSAKLKELKEAENDNQNLDG